MWILIMTIMVIGEDLDRGSGTSVSISTVEIEEQHICELAAAKWKADAHKRLGYSGVKSSAICVEKEK